MREIGTINREKDARVLADYLLTLEISTKLVARADGSWAVWVHKEDRVPEARAILDRFAVYPDDPAFHAAAPTAREIRKQAEKAESDYRKRVRDLRDRWEGPIYRRAPLTFALIVASVIVTGLVNTSNNAAWTVRSALSFSVLEIDDDGFVRDRGIEAIRRGEAWRLLTPIFLHGGIAHLFFNMLALMAFGQQIEMRKGTWRLALFVVVTAVASNAGQFYSKSIEQLPGNFGGISGVVFAMAGYLWAKGQVDPEDGLMLDQRSMNWMLAWLVLGIVAAELAPPGSRGFPYNMANVAHGVGLASGIGIGLFRV